jgi:lipopolysaccharide export LptBFGC system permease protein LptF
MGKHDRKKKRKKQLLPKFIIVCEGEKTEPKYLKAYIEEKGFTKNYIAKIKIIDTKKNTAKELIREALKSKELKNDELWVVFDKDGYTKHPEAFDHARAKNVHIAFSSICFETWVLLHFEYTTAAFANYDELFDKKLEDHIKNYEKGIDGLYDLIKNKTDFAVANAKRLNSYSHEGNPRAPIYQLKKNMTKLETEKQLL